MRLSSGKASGKTITLTAYLDWFEDATGINDSDPKEWHELRERIAELEAELASECGLSSIQRDALDAQGRNLEKAEAEVERLKKVLSFAIQVLDEYEPEWREPMEEELKGGGRESESLLAKKA